MKRLIVLALLAMTLFTGCQTIRERSAANKLQSTLRSYEATVRWGNPLSAYDFLAPELREKTTPPDNLDNIRVTSYEPLTPAASIDETTATQRVKISYVLRDQQVQRTLTDDQVWQQQGKKKNWLRINPIPEFK